MKSLLPLAAAVALFLGFSAPVAAQTMSKLGSLGNWQIDASDTLCRARSMYEGGTYLTFMLNTKGGASMGVENPKWTIPEGSYEVLMHVDRSAVTRHTAKAGTDAGVGWVGWQISLNEANLNLLSYGNVLYVRIGFQDISYRLDRSEAVLKALGQCVATRMQAANPFAGGQSPVAPPSTNPFPETASNPYRRM